MNSTRDRKRELLDACRGYFKRGWQSVPLDAGTKKCTRPEWQNEYLTFPQIKGILTPRSNIGLQTCGELRDVDLDWTEACTLADLFLPETSCEFGRASKPRSHRLYLAAESDYVPYRDPAEPDKKRQMIVELRADAGHQTMAPPSIHPDGELVRWDRDGEPTRVELTDLRRRCGLLATAALLSRHYAGHEMRYAVAGLALKGGVPREDVERVLYAITTLHDGDRPDVKTAIDSTARNIAAGKKVAGFSKLKELIGEPRARKVAEWLGCERPAVWSAPIPLDAQCATAPIPLDGWPPWIRDYASALATAYQVPLEVPAFLVLAALAVALARKYAIRILPDWCEALVLWLVLALPPSERKTPPVERVTAPIRGYERDKNAELAPKITEAEQRLRILTERVKLYESKSARAEGGNERLAADAEATAARSELEKVVVPPPVRLLTDDVTVERMGAILVEQGERIGIISDEGGIFDTIAGRYSDKGSNIDLYLRGYSGAPHRVDRGSRPPDHLSKPAITLAAMVQPFVLESLASNEAFRGRGLLARPLYSVPAPRAGYRAIAPPPVGAEHELAWTSGLRSLLELPTPKDGPSELHLDTDASAALLEYARQIEERQRLDGDLHGIAEWAGKLAGNVARIAALLSLASAVGPGDASENLTPISPQRPGGSPPETVSLSSIKAAIAMSEYLIEHARVAFGMMGADPALADARRVLRSVRKYAGGEVKRGAIHRATRLERRRLDAAIALLQDYGWIRHRRESTDGRTADVYEVHPDAAAPAGHPGKAEPYGVSGFNGGKGDTENEIEPQKPLTPRPEPGPAEGGEELDIAIGGLP